jgi:hypothetical protein
MKYDNIKTGLLEMQYEYVDWIELTQGRMQRRTLVSTVMKLRIP